MLYKLSIRGKRGKKGRAKAFDKTQLSLSLKRTKERKKNFNPAIGNFLWDMSTMESLREDKSLGLNVALLSSFAKSLVCRCLQGAVSLISEFPEVAL